MATFPTGVTIVTSITPHGPYGVTVNAFTSVSQQPPLVLVCLSTAARSRGVLACSGVFAVNILSDGQTELAQRFARTGRPSGATAFAGIGYHTLRSGSPILHGVTGYLDCALAGMHDAGDHTIIVGEVLALGSGPPVRPLVFHRSGYVRLA